MSTVMYVYRVMKKDLWDLHAIVREWSFTHSLAAKAYWTHRGQDHLARLAGETSSQTRDFLDRWQKANEYSHDNEDISLQLFDENETSYLIRPISTYSNPGFFEKVQQDSPSPFTLEKVFYDNRADMPEEQAANKGIAEWLDKEINNKRYLTVPVLQAMDFCLLMYEKPADDDPRLVAGIARAKAQKKCEA